MEVDRNMAVQHFKLLSCLLFCSLNLPDVFSEPHCSKFHYEERLLEKVVRLEFKLDQMEKGFKAMERTILDERSKIQDDASNLKTFVETLTKASKSKLEAMENDVKLVGEKMLKDVQDATSALEMSRQQNEANLVRLSEDTKTFQNDIMSNISDLIKVPDVLFKAKNLAKSELSAGETFAFKTIVENTGDGYNADHGIFTAPIGGDYLFTAQMCIRVNNNVCMTFVVDGVDQTPMVISGSSYTCGTGTLLSKLTPGTRVWLKATYPSNAYTDSARTNTLSGILLKT